MLSAFAIFANEPVDLFGSKVIAFLAILPFVWIVIIDIVLKNVYKERGLSKGKAIIVML